MCQESGEVQYKKAGIFLFLGGYMLRKYQGENLRSDSTLHIRSLPHDLVTGRIPHTGSRQCVSGEAPSRSQAAVLPAVVQGLDSSPSHHALSDTQPYLPFSLPKATKPSVPRTEAETQEHTLPIPVQAHLSLLHAKAPEAWQAPSLSEFRPCPSSLFLAPGA